MNLDKDSAVQFSQEVLASLLWGVADLLKAVRERIE